MLGTYAYALTLYAVDHGCTDKTGHERVFGIVFKVAATERRAHDVHARTKDNIAAVFQRLVTHSLAHAFHQFGVPCGGQQRADGKSRAIVGIRVVGAFFRDMHAGRTISKYRVGDAQALYLGRVASCTQHNGSCIGVGVAGKSPIAVAEGVAHQHGSFLLKGHLFQYLVDVLGRQFRLCHSRSCHHSRRDNKFCFHYVFKGLIITVGKNSIFFSHDKENT